MVVVCLACKLKLCIDEHIYLSIVKQVIQSKLLSIYVYEYIHITYTNVYVLVEVMKRKKGGMMVGGREGKGLQQSWERRGGEDGEEYGGHDRSGGRKRTWAKMTFYLCFQLIKNKFLKQTLKKYSYSIDLTIINVSSTALIAIIL